MKMYQIIDSVQLKINSLLFRIIIIIYGVFILLINNNIFPVWAYVFGTVFYFIIYFFLSNFPKIRLINDFLFIIFILIGKTPNDVINFSFLVLPIINSINFSGKKKSILLYFYTLILYLFFSCFFYEKYNIEHICGNLYPLVTIIFLWLINYYTSQRTKIRSFREELNSEVDGFYLREEEIKRPHMIYKRLINAIHRNMGSELIEEIICSIIITGNNDKMIMVNGSSFIWQFKSIDSSVLISKIREKKFLINEVYYLENKVKSYSLTLYTKVEEQEYVYTIITKKPIPFYYHLIGFFRILEPLFTKISRILLAEKKLQEIQMEEILKLSERSQYVNRANKTMHFMRNRLGPFSNLLKMLNEFKSIPNDKIDAFRDLLYKEKDRADLELKNITQRATDMLEKSNNPFVYNILDKISIEKIFVILKRNFNSFFPNEELDIYIAPALTKKYANLNEEGFELFLSDWFSNMEKYKKKFVSCVFSLEESELKIIFNNDHTLKKEETDQMIMDLTSNDRNEIMKRTTHGLFIIKSTLEDMGIPLNISKLEDGSIISLTLILKTFDYVDSSI